MYRSLVLRHLFFIPILYVGIIKIIKSKKLTSWNFFQCSVFFSVFRKNKNKTPTLYLTRHNELDWILNTAIEWKKINKKKQTIIKGNGYIIFSTLELWLPVSKVDRNSVKNLSMSQCFAFYWTFEGKWGEQII